MFKKIVIITIATMLVSAICFAAVFLGSRDAVSLPQKITQDSACPVAGCASDECHASKPAPELDGSFTMECPKVEGCASTECHAWEALTTHYNQPRNWSMNIWIIAPVVFVIALVLIVKKL